MLLNSLAEDFFGETIGVDVGRVECLNAEIVSVVHRTLVNVLVRRKERGNLRGFDLLGTFLLAKDLEVAGVSIRHARYGNGDGRTQDNQLGLP